MLVCVRVISKRRSSPRSAVHKSRDLTGCMYMLYFVQDLTGCMYMLYFVRDFNGVYVQVYFVRDLTGYMYMHTLFGT